MIKEDRVKEKIKSRTYSEKCEIWSIRAVTFTINIIIVLASWAGIYYVNANYSSIESTVNTYAWWLKYVSPFIPSLCLTGINLVLPTITNLLISCERWDFESTVVINEVLRNFLAK